MSQSMTKACVKWKGSEELVCGIHYHSLSTGSCESLPIRMKYRTNTHRYVHNVAVGCLPAPGSYSGCSSLSPGTRFPDFFACFPGPWNQIVGKKHLNVLWHLYPLPILHSRT
jgi:hypothetical protein